MGQICAMEDRIIVVATHDLDEENIYRFDYVYILENGKIVAHDCPENIVKSPAFLSLRQGENEK